MTARRHHALRPRYDLAGLLCWALIAGGCASAGARVDDPGTATVMPGTTLAGNYLAARHARLAREEADAAEFLKAALELAPDDQPLLSRAYTTLILDGRVALGIDVARRYLQAGGASPVAAVAVAVDDIHAGRFDAALARLSAIRGEHALGVLLPLMMAWSEFGLGRTDAAMARLKPLADSNRGAATLYHLHAAWIADAAGRPDEAVPHLNAALDQQTEPWFRLAELAGATFERAGDPARAEALYDGYRKRHPGSRLLAPAAARLQAGTAPAVDVATAADGAAEALFDSAGILARQNNRETALVLGELGLYLRPDFPALQIIVADLLEGFGRYEDANRVYDAIEREAPLAWTARMSRARNLERMDDDQAAEAALRALAAERPDEAEPLVELGDMMRRQERFADAVAVYDQAFARIGTLAPQHWRLLYARGIALEREKQWPRAEADFLKALEFEPDQPFVLNYLGYSWVEQGRNLAEAEQMIRKAVALRPSDGYIVDSLGWVLYRLGRADEAVSELERAVELKPEDPVINDHLGDVYWSVGRQREARFQWRTALDAKLQHGPMHQANADPR
jgi:tetratricopeptide (TPR) repeat protein